MWIIISLTVLFFISTCSLAYACFNLVKKVEVYEEWVSFFRGEIENVHARLKMVDDKNLFEKDDDVGFVFSEILRVTKEFNERIK
jgi:hypothetical protein